MAFAPFRWDTVDQGGMECAAPEDDGLRVGCALYRWGVGAPGALAGTFGALVPPGGVVMAFAPFGWDTVDQGGMECAAPEDDGLGVGCALYRWGQLAQEGWSGLPLHRWWRLLLLLSSDNCLLGS